MDSRNNEIADKFETLADLLAIEGANRFRIRAYRNAADTLHSWPKSICKMVEDGEDLTHMPTIGHDLAGQIGTWCRTGRLPMLDQVARRTPPALRRLLAIRGLGPRRVAALYENLGVRSEADLLRVARRGEMRKLPGIGARIEAAVLRSLGERASPASRYLRNEARAIAEPLLAWLRSRKGVRRVVLAGSYRRGKETIGDLDILVTAVRGSKVLAGFPTYDEVAKVESLGPTRATARLHSGMQVDIRLVSEASYGAALVYFTGSKAHNIALRALARERAMKINEYGVFRDGRKVAGRTEKDVYATVGLSYIEPELRRNHGELEAAAVGRLPRLVTRDALRGDLHCHTRASDGRDDLVGMAQAAAALGYEYLAITDHTRGLRIANGLDARRLRKQIDAIDAYNESQDDVVILKGAEVEILEDGRLDLPDSVLAELDFTVGAIHSHMDLSREAQTRRILCAMDNRHFNIFAHPGGGLINERPPCAMELTRVLDGARERGCFVEVNSQPQRLDLNGDACLLARELGVMVAISSDAHSTAGLDGIVYGIEQARRGWLEAGQVVNTRSLRDLVRLLRRD